MTFPVYVQSSLAFQLRRAGGGFGLVEFWLAYLPYKTKARALCVLLVLEPNLGRLCVEISASC